MAAVLAAELPDLPPAGPATLEAVKDQLRIDPTDTADDAYLARLVSGVNRKVRRWPVAGYASQAGTLPADRSWPEDILEGAVMLVARLARRRNSPAGFESFAGEGAVYVQRNDPDIAQLLELGAYQGPVLG